MTAIRMPARRPVLYQPAITQLSISPARWRVDEDLAIASLGCRLFVPRGFITDLASIPRWLWPIVAPFELSIAAPVVHDWLYGHGGLMRPAAGMSPIRYTRSQADAFLYDVAAQDGVWWWRRAAAHTVVRDVGARRWNATGVLAA